MQATNHKNGTQDVTHDATHPPAHSPAQPAVQPLHPVAGPPTATGSEDLSPAQIVELFDVARTEATTIDQLAGCVADLNRAQEAKRRLSGLTAEQMRTALEYRRRNLSEAR